MSHILPALFNRRAELVAALSGIDSLIMAESNKYSSADNTSYPYHGSEATTVHTLPASNQPTVKIPPGLTIKASVIYVLQQGPEEGMTVRDIRTILRTVNGPDRALNIDQVMVGLMKAGKAKSITTTQ